LTDFDEIWQDDAAILSVPTVKISQIYKSKMVTAILKIEKMPHLDIQPYLHSSRQSVAGYIGAVWRIQLNSRFLRPTRVHNANGKSIGSAVSVQLTAVTMGDLFPKIARSHGDMDPI